MHNALRMDMRMFAEALSAMQTWLDADELLKPWQVKLCSDVHCTMIVSSPSGLAHTQPALL